MKQDNTTCMLQRFIDAQNAVYTTVITELEVGRKTSHWIWFIFPQLKGLGRSSIAQHFGIESAAEARAFLLHPVLGERLRYCTNLMLSIPDKSAYEILGTPDDLKFHSCLTLFSQANPEEAVFRWALDRFYSGKSDTKTLVLLPSEN